MKVLQINSIYPVKSTGRIVKELEEVQLQNGIEPYIAAGWSTVKKDNVYVIGSDFYNKLSILKTRLFGKHGFYNRTATKKLLKWIDKVRPDVIHLHNIHGHYINIRLLFEYIKKHDIPVVWTLHDCWSFTGHCAHFDFVGCDKWKTGCGACPMQKSYPISLFFDRSAESFKDKKALFNSVDKMTLVTPSGWLKGLCEQSYIGKYPIEVLHNGIDTDVFAPCESSLKAELGIENKFVILGIVNSFSGYKGGKDFLRLSEMLGDDEVIVLLSLDVPKSEIPHNIIPLPATSDDRRIAQVYSMADVFVNPTLQDNFPTVNIEAISCGTPVVTYNTGGAAESQSGKTGLKVARGDTEGLYKAIRRVRNGEFSSADCRERALEFKKKDCYQKYIDIYNSFC